MYLVSSGSILYCLLFDSGARCELLLTAVTAVLGVLVFTVLLATLTLGGSAETDLIVPPVQDLDVDACGTKFCPKAGGAVCPKAGGVITPDNRRKLVKL